MRSTFSLPYLLQSWPWKRTVNPHYEDFRREYLAWSRQYNALSPKAQAAFELFDADLLASLACPNLSKDGCRVICDLLFWLSYFDDSTDDMKASEVQEWVDIVMDILRDRRTTPDPKWPLLGTITVALWTNAKKSISESCRELFVEDFRLYLQSVVDQAALRDSNLQLTPSTYMTFRRGNLGARPMFVLTLMEMEIPSTFFQSESLVKLRSCAVDLILIANDLYSYNVEQSRNDVHNLVTVVMLQHGFTLHEAVNHVSSMHENVASQFLEITRNLTSFGSPELDTLASKYIDGLGNWVRANDCWSFEGRRYFRDEGLRIKEQRVVELLPMAAL